MAEEEMRPGEPFRSELSALAIATTIYHEASPDMMEEARLQYSLALDRFRAAQSAQPDAEISRDKSSAVDSESQQPA